MRILLCLLSGQHVPNLLSVHHFAPDRLVLVETPAMRKQRAADCFLRALELGGQDFRLRSIIQPLDSEDCLDSVSRALREAFGRFPTDDWVINLSGGTKPMSIAAYEFFKALGARLVYINVPRPNELLGLDGKPAEACAYRPSVVEFLAGYGFERRKDARAVAEAESRARSLWPCARHIAATCPERTLLALGDLQDPELKKLWDKARKKGLELQPHHVADLPANASSEIARGLGLSLEQDRLVGKLDKYGVEFLTGGWLEVFLWGLLDRCAADLGIWDVRLGAQFGKMGIETDSEFDIAFMHRYRLAVVECKSGAQEHDPGADVLHKLEAVVRQFRALLVTSYLATTSPNVWDKDQAIRPTVRNRAAIYDCRILDRHAIQQLALVPEPAPVLRELLFQSLGS